MADFSSNTLVLDAILRELQLADDQNYRPLNCLTSRSGDLAADVICFASNTAFDLIFYFTAINANIAYDNCIIITSYIGNSDRLTIGKPILKTSDVLRFG